MKLCETNNPKFPYKETNNFLLFGMFVKTLKQSWVVPYQNQSGCYGNDVHHHVYGFHVGNEVSLHEEGQDQFSCECWEQYQQGGEGTL